MTKQSKIYLKSALIGAVATVIIMVLCSLPYFAIIAIGKAWDRQEQGQKAFIERHKLENRGIL